MVGRPSRQTGKQGGNRADFTGRITQVRDAVVVGPGGVVWTALSGLPEHRTRQKVDRRVQLSAER